MSQNRVLDPSEVAALSAAQNRNKEHKLKLCKNDNCDNEFTPKRADQVYCSNRCRLTAIHAKNVREAEELTGRTCAWCGSKLPPEMKSSAKFCSDKCRALAFKARPCVYCGDIADSRDHFIPRAFVDRMEDLGWVKDRDIMVPCCRECNSTAGSKVFVTLKEKRNYIKEQYKKKYHKLLDMPNWTDSELENYGYSLRMHVKHSLTAKKELEARLRWPKL